MVESKKKFLVWQNAIQTQYPLIIETMSFSFCNNIKQIWLRLTSSSVSSTNYHYFYLQIYKLNATKTKNTHTTHTHTNTLHTHMSHTTPTHKQRFKKPNKQRLWHPASSIKAENLEFSRHSRLQNSTSNSTTTQRMDDKSVLVIIHWVAICYRIN